MKYQAEDKVKIKTWKEMEKEFGLNDVRSIPCGADTFNSSMEKILRKKFPNRILIIEKRHNTNMGKECYRMRNISFNWTDNMIKCLVKDYKKEEPIPINNRFEILDIR